jgi:POT family proton-dependent oligopeptide transporter
MTAGFLFCGAAMFYAAFVQQKIYTAPPCFDHPRARDCLEGDVANEVSIVLQLAQYVFIALAEILAAVAGIEYAYTKAPSSMKSLVMAVYLLNTSAGASIAMLASSWAKDPNLVWMYLILGTGPLVAGITLVALGDA